MTRQRTPSQDRTEYSQNTYYSHITRGDAYHPKQEPAPSQHTDYGNQTTNQSTNVAPCRYTPSPNHTQYSAQDTDHCGTLHHEAPHCDNRDDSPGTGPQTETIAAEITQPSPPEDHTHEAALSVSSGTSSTAMDIHSLLPTPPEPHDPPLESLPSGLDISTNRDPMDLDNDPLQDSIQRVLQVAADAHQQPTWSLYRALNEADQRITSTGSNRDPGAYIQALRRDIHNAQQQSPEGVVVQGRECKTGAWTNLTWAPHAEEALDFIQESDAPPPATLEETAEALVLTLHSCPRGHTIVLHDKTGPPYARTATCQLSIAATGEANLEWKPEREDDEYTLVHATRHGRREEKEPTPEPAATPPTETNPPTLDPVPTAGPCPHPSGAQYLAVHGGYIRGTHATRLDQVRNGRPGGTHGPAGRHVLHNLGRHSAGRRHRSAGYDRSSHVRRRFQTRAPVWRQQKPRHHERHPGLPQLVHSAKHPPPHPAR